MRSKKEKRIYLAGGIMSVAALAAVSVGIVNAKESILAESVSVQVSANQAPGEAASVERITTGQITTGQAAEEDETGAETVSYTTNESVESSPIVETWVPQTAEEKQYYSYVGTEKLAVSTSGTTGVRAANSVQGPLCQKAFESVLGDYSIARTYNIFPGNSNLKQPVHELEDEVVITMEIPRSLQKEGRSFELICVSKGVPYVFKDMDDNASSITISTKYFYAYALCYKD